MNDPSTRHSSSATAITTNTTTTTVVKLLIFVIVVVTLSVTLLLLLSPQSLLLSSSSPPWSTGGNLFTTATTTIGNGKGMSLFRVEYPSIINPIPDICAVDDPADIAAGTCGATGTDDADKAILVTGTSRGIGHDICTYLATKYPSVHIYCGVRKKWLSSSPQSPTTTTTTRITTTNNNNIHQIVLDITNDQDILQALETIQHHNQHRLVAVINNAGIIDVGTVEFTPIKTWKAIMDVNVLGTVRMIQSSLPTIRQNNGRIIIVGSTAGLIAGIPRYGAYQSSKYALEAVADSLRKECLEHNVSVSLIEPGVVETDMTKVQIQTPQDISTQERHAYPILYNTQKPTKNYNDDNDAAAAAASADDEIATASPSSSAYMDFMNRFVTIPGSVDDTLRAIDHALVDKYPKARYRTAWLGIGPSWLVVPLYRALPDRLFDWLIVHCPRLLLKILCMIFD